MARLCPFRQHFGTNVMHGPFFFLLDSTYTPFSFFFLHHLSKFAQGVALSDGLERCPLRRGLPGGIPFIRVIKMAFSLALDLLYITLLQAICIPYYSGINTTFQWQRTPSRSRIPPSGKKHKFHHSNQSSLIQTSRCSKATTTLRG